MSVVDIVYAGLLPELASQGIEDTTQNRVDALQGLYDAWTEDTSDDCREKTVYVTAVAHEITLLRMRLLTTRKF